MRHSFYIILILLFTSVAVEGQVYNMIDQPTFSTGFMSGHPGGLNESYNYRFKVFLPSVNIGFSQNGPSIYDLIKQDAAGDYFINFTQEENLEDLNPYQGSLSVTTIGFAMNLKNWNFSIGHAARIIGQLEFPDDTYFLLKNGNAPFIGEEVSVGVAAQATSFNQYMLGASYGTDIFRIGLRGKFLFGSQDVSTEEFGVRLFTDDDIYQLRFNNNYIINSSSIFTYNDLDDYSFDFDRTVLNSLFTNNVGFGFDVGMSFKVAESSTIGVAIYDIGKITWKEDPSNYNSKGGFSFDGIDIATYIGSETVVELRDSLLNLLKFEETNESYSSKLPLQFNVSLVHSLNDNLAIEAAFNLATINGSSAYNFRVGALYQLSDFSHLGVSYSYNQFEILNVGLSAVGKFGPVQLFARTDNILGVFQPIKNGYTNGFLGINLLFGTPEPLEASF